MADEIRSAIIIDTSKSLDNLKNLENEFNNLNQSGEEFKQKQSDIEKAMSDNAISALNNAKSIGEMRKAIKEVTSLQLSGILSESESRKLSSALGEAKDRVADLREETASMAGTRVEILTNNFARLKESIFNLDLDKFKSSLSGIKTGLMGAEGGFKGLGKAIVATGIGALVVVVGLLIANFDKLAGAGGLVGKIFTGVGAIIKSVTKFFTDLTDAIGLTSIATNEAAAAQRDYNNAVKEGATNLNALYIKGLRGRARETAELNKQITDDLKANQDKQNEITAKAAEEKRALSKEELRRLEDLKKESLQIYENGELAQKELKQKFADEDEEKRKEKLKKDLADSEKEAKEKAEKEAENEANIAKWKKEAEDRIKAQFAKEAEEQAAKNEKAGGQNTSEVFKTLGLPTPTEINAAMGVIKEKNKEKVANNKATEEAILKNKKDIANSAIGITNDLMGAMGKSEEFNKAFALGQVAFDTGTALVKALNVSQSASGDNVATGGLAGIAKYAALAAMIITNSVKAVNIIKSKKAPSSGGGGGGGSSIPTMSTPQMLPQFNMGDLSQVGRNMPSAGNQRSQVVVTNKDIVEANTVAVSTNNVISL